MSANARLQSVDLLRGLAIALMIAFHFSYDLAHFGFARFDFYHDPFWLHARTLILSTFLLTAGVSLTLATRSGVRWRPYLRRLGWIAGCAALISLASHLMFGPRWIFFGVLHFIAAASVIGLPFVRAPRLALAAGLALLVLGNTVAHPLFDRPALQWIGLMTHKPPTEDYVPLLPWFGVVLVGVFLGDRLWARAPSARLARWRSDRPPARLLALAGRHSLLIYMLHQPLLIGTLWLVKRALA